MAAGEGRRLRPLTERWPKPVLPIDGRPVIATLLREVAAAGFEGATVVVGHLGNQVRALAGDGSAFGLPLTYAEQPEARGSADAVSRALAAGARPPVLVLAADMVFTPGDLARTREEWIRSRTAGGLGVRELGPAELRGETRVRVEGGRVVAIGGEPQARRHGTLTGAPVWFLNEEVAATLDALPGPPYELAVAFARAIAAGKPIAALELGPTRDITHPEDVVTRNFPYLSSGGKEVSPAGLLPSEQ